MKKSNARGFLLALCGTAIVSTNWVTAKFGLEGFDYDTFSLLWTGCGAAFALVAVLILCKPTDLRLSRRDLVLALIMGVATAAGMITSWAGLAVLDPSFQAFLFRFMPVLTVLLGAAVLREKFHAIEVLPLGLMIVGGLASTMGRFEVVGAGVALTLASCVGFAIQMVLAKVMVSRVNPTVIAFYRLLFGVFFIALWVVPTGKLDFAVEPRYWAVTVLGSLLGPCMSHILTFRSYRHWELSRTAMVSATQPLFVIPLAIAFLGKSPKLAEAAGGGVILAGAIWFSWIEMRGASSRQGEVA